MLGVVILACEERVVISLDVLEQLVERGADVFKSEAATGKGRAEFLPRCTAMSTAHPSQQWFGGLTRAMLIVQIGERVLNHGVADPFLA